MDEPIIDFHVTTLAMLNLCELLILELKISDTPDQLFEEITEYSQHLYSIAQTQKSPYLNVMILILQTKLSMVKGDVEQANNLLNTAKDIAEGKNLSTLLSEIKKEQEIIQSELDKWQELFKRQASLQERLEQARVSNYLQEAKKIQEAWVQPPAEMTEEK